MSYYYYAAIAQNLMLNKHNLMQAQQRGHLLSFYLPIFPRIFTHFEHYSSHKNRSECHPASAPTAKLPAL